jgi:oligoribonuclease
MNNQRRLREPIPLVWIDLEMTGLDPHKDVMLEIASIVTDSDLNIIAYGPDIVIHQSDEILQNMNPWCIKYHGLSGLTKAVQESTTTLQEAQQATLDFIKQYCPYNTARLCGNSVWQDRLFLSKYMPDIIAYINYRLIDVSSIKEIIRRWYPDNPATDFLKAESHRALNDIKESIAELNHYRKNFFIPREIE